MEIAKKIDLIKDKKENAKIEQIFRNAYKKLEVGKVME